MAGPTTKTRPNGAGTGAMTEGQAKAKLQRLNIKRNKLKDELAGVEKEIGEVKAAFPGLATGAGKGGAGTAGR